MSVNGNGIDGSPLVNINERVLNFRSPQPTGRAAFPSYFYFCISLSPTGAQVLLASAASIQGRPGATPTQNAPPNRAHAANSLRKPLYMFRFARRMAARGLNRAELFNQGRTRSSLFSFFAKMRCCIASFLYALLLFLWCAPL